MGAQEGTGVPGVSVALESVTMTYPGGGDGFTAVSGLDLTVEPGRFVAMVGPTGCGKSTVLNAVAGLLAPTAGRVLIDGRPLNGLNRRAGYLFQSDALLPWKTVLENVAFAAQLAGAGKAERNERARDWVRRVGLSGFENAYPHQLSGGMRKRAAVAQTWLADPQLLLMDEPFAALDVQTRRVMEDELLGLWTGTAKTVLLVTHDLDEAISLADEVVLLSAGPSSRLIGRYPVDLPRPRQLMDLRTRPEFTEIYRAIWNDLRDEVMAGYDRENRDADLAG